MAQPYSKNPAAYNDVVAVYRAMFRQHPLHAQLKSDARHNDFETLLIPVLIAAQPSEAEGKAILDMMEFQGARTSPQACLSAMQLLRYYTTEVGNLIGTGRTRAVPETILLPKPSNAGGWQKLLDRCMAASSAPPKDGAWLLWTRATSIEVTEGQGGMERKPWQQFERPAPPEAVPAPEVKPRPFTPGASLDI